MVGWLLIILLLGIKFRLYLKKNTTHGFFLYGRSNTLLIASTPRMNGLLGTPRIKIAGVFDYP